MTLTGEQVKEPGGWRRPMKLSGAQAKAGRGLLGWSLVALSAKCRIGATTIRLFEIGERRPRQFEVLAIRRALEAAGAEFDDKRHGVRLREGK
jgi:hypothetical protein